MNITADTNVLVRALVEHEPAQAAEASRVMREATSIAVPLPVLCELVWVLKRVYSFATVDMAGRHPFPAGGRPCAPRSTSRGSWSGPAGGWW